MSRGWWAALVPPEQLEKTAKYNTEGNTEPAGLPGARSHCPKGAAWGGHTWSGPAGAYALAWSHRLAELLHCPPSPGPPTPDGFSLEGSGPILGGLLSEVRARREETLRSQLVYPKGPACSAEFPGTLSLFQPLGCRPSGPQRWLMVASAMTVPGPLATGIISGWDCQERALGPHGARAPSHAGKWRRGRPQRRPKPDSLFRATGPSCRCLTTVC